MRFHSERIVSGGKGQKEDDSFEGCGSHVGVGGLFVLAATLRETPCMYTSYVGRLAVEEIFFTYLLC